MNREMGAKRKRAFWNTALMHGFCYILLRSRDLASMRERLPRVDSFLQTASGFPIHAGSPATLIQTTRRCIFGRKAAGLCDFLVFIAAGHPRPHPTRPKTPPPFPPRSHDRRRRHRRLHARPTPYPRARQKCAPSARRCRSDMVRPTTGEPFDGRFGWKTMMVAW